MGTEPIPDLLKKWTLEQLTVEMAIGHLLQHVKMLHDTDQEANRQRHQMTRLLTDIQVTLRSLRTDVDALIAHTGMPPALPKPKRGRPPKDDVPSQSSEVC